MGKKRVDSDGKSVRSSKPCITPFLKQCFVTSGVSLNMAGTGLVLGFTTGLLEQLQHTDHSIPIDHTSGSWIAAMPGLSLVFGNFIASPTMSKYGRKTANLITIIPMIVGWAAIYFAKSVIVLMVARFLQGLSMGMCTSLSSLLIGEYTSPKNRGAFLMTITVSVATAVMSVHCLGSYLTWHTTALICGCVSIVDLFIVMYSPESPSWLAEKGKYDACKKSFRWLRGDTEEEELSGIIKAVIILKEAQAEMNQSKSRLKKCKEEMEYFKATVKKREFFNPIIIMIHFYFLAQWSGINMLVAYPIHLYDAMVGKDCNIPLLVITLDAHRIVANTTALFVIRKVKRRTVLGVTVGINIFALLANAAYCYAKETGHIATKEFTLGVALTHIHMFAVGTGSLPLCFIIAGEIFPLEYRNLASGISVTFYSINLFLNLKTAPYLLRSIDLYGMYILYACIMLYSLIVVWCMLPETKDRTLQDIEDEFRGRPMSPDEMKSMQSLRIQSSRALNNIRRVSNPVII